MRKKIFIISCLTFCLSLITLPMAAQQVSEASARQKALSFLSSHATYTTGTRKAPRPAPQLTLIPSSGDELYIFNDVAGGYVIVSGDERMPDVLGYSTDGSLNADNMPLAMQSWLENYAGQIQFLRDHPEAQGPQRVISNAPEVEPFMNHILWGQRYPFNLECPEQDGTHCVTGCVATAMAMVMYYYQWPKQTAADYPDMPQTTFDYDNMLPSYKSKGQNTAEQETAVAHLMAMCGKSVGMRYGLTESFAAYSTVRNVMYDYFGYEDDLKLVQRDSKRVGGLLETGFDDETWESMLYDELKAGRPVMYSGYHGLFYGHAFVLDGYRDGYFHVNWGGGSNGYFLLTNLGGWNELQNAIIHIRPARSGDRKMYSVADYTNKKLTFYYDDKMKERAATVDGNTTGKVKRLPVKTNDAYYKDGACDEICFDASMTDYHFITTVRMFQNCKVKRISGLKYLNTSCVSSMDVMFYRCNVEEPLDLSHLDTRRVMSMRGMFNSLRIAGLDLRSFNTEKVTDMSSMFGGCTITSRDLSNLNTANVTDMSGMFWDCGSLTSLNLSGLNTENVINMSQMFRNCTALPALDLSGLNTENVTSMSQMFNGCSSLTSLDLSGWNTANVTNMSMMFSGCNITNLDLRNFNMEKVTDMSSMFSDCTAASINLSGLNTANVTNMINMFSGCRNLTSLDLSGLNTAKVTNMSGMFSGCAALTCLDLSGMNTTKVTDMSQMFSGCAALTCLDLSGMNTTKVTDMSQMFSGCTALTSLNLSGMNTENVTNMSRMFYGCSSLASLDLSGLNTENVTNMNSMFAWCGALVSLNLSGLNTANVTTVNGMFSRCKALTSLDLSCFNTEKVTEMSEMFSGCSKLKTIFVSADKWSDKGDLDGAFLPDDWERLVQMYRRQGMDDKQIEEMKESMMRYPGKEVFKDCNALVGGAGTKCSANKISSKYACIDGGPDKPGYLTDIKEKDKVNGINTVNADGNSAPIYTLSGTKVLSSAQGTDCRQRGIYIQSGRKMILGR